MTKEVATIAAEFLLRTDLKGRECPAMMAVMNALQDIVEGRVVMQAAEEPAVGEIEVNNESEQ